MKAAWPSVHAEGDLTQGANAHRQLQFSDPQMLCLTFLPGDDDFHLNLQASGTNVWWLLWAIVL